MSDPTTPEVDPKRDAGPDPVCEGCGTREFRAWPRRCERCGGVFCHTCVHRHLSHEHSPIWVCRPRSGVVPVYGPGTEAALAGGLLVHDDEGRPVEHVPLTAAGE